MDEQHLENEELVQLLRALPEMLIVTDTDRTVRFVNRVQAGYELNDLLGADALAFIEPDFREQQAELFDRVVETEEPASYEIPITDAEGERQWYEGTLIPITDRGKVSGVAIVTRNVTEKHQAQAEAEQLRKLVPVCSWCGSVRDDEGYWKTLASYIEEAGGSRVTHGMCPTCTLEVEKGENEA